MRCGEFSTIKIDRLNELGKKYEIDD